MSAPYDPEHITYFGETDFRNQRTKFGIKSRDRTRHMYVIGKSGVGKSTLLENMAIQDIQTGQGLAVLDPHGSFAEKMLDYVPADRIKDVIYFAPFDTDHPISFNVLEDVGADKRHLVVSGLMSTFKKIWVDAWSARMEYILGNTLLALLEYPDATLLGVNRMLSDKEFRKKVVDNITDTSVKAFWTEEFAKYTERMAAEAVPAIQNKIGQLTANPLIRNIIGQPKSSFDIRKAMDEQKILIINLSKGRIGDTNTSLLGSMIITKIYLAAMSRAESASTVFPNFYFYVDEFQSFANETFADILAEARKYKLALIIAHQYVAQMEEKVRDAVFGNVGTTISFRVGPLDAELLEKVFAPQFTANDLINLGMAQIYLSLMINDIGSAPFSARTLPPVPHATISYRNDCIEWSRQAYSVDRGTVEGDIATFYAKEAREEGEYKRTYKNEDVSRIPMRPRPAAAGPASGQRRDAPTSIPQRPKPPQPMQQPFKKAFSTLGSSAEQSSQEAAPLKQQASSAAQPTPEPAPDAHQPRMHAKPLLRTQGRTAPQKTLFKRVTESSRAAPAPQQPVAQSASALKALLDTVSFEKTAASDIEKRVSEKPEQKSAPVAAGIVDDKPFEKQDRQPVKAQERAAKDSSKDLLRQALAKAQAAPAPHSAVQSETQSAVSAPEQKSSSISDGSKPSDSSESQNAPNEEVSYEALRKILE